MPGSIEKARGQDSDSPIPNQPSISQPPANGLPLKYGAKIQQYAAPDDNSIPLDSAGITLLQQIIGTFLFYACQSSGSHNM
jgi:hypothetical protein